MPAPAVLDVNLDATPAPAPNLQADLHDDHQADLEGDLQVISEATSTSIATDHRQPAGDRKNVFLQNKPNLPLFIWLLLLQGIQKARFLRPFAAFSIGFYLNFLAGILRLEQKRTFVHGVPLFGGV